MIVERVVAPALSTNCYVVAGAPRGRCVVVDPGAGAAPLLDPVLERHGLTVGAVLLTHGHPDHVWDAHAVGREVATSIAAPDRPLLDQPDSVHHLGAELSGLFPLLAGTAWHTPTTVTTLDPALLSGGGAEVVRGVSVRAVPAPGHTRGSAIFLFGGTLDSAELAAEARVESGVRPFGAFGDVLFAGSVGRTDLPGGDEEEMDSTLRTLAVALDPATVVLPGHGPATTLRRELDTNPFLQFTD